MYFAIITKGIGYSDQDPTKRWAMTGADKKALIELAIAERRKSESNGYGPYQILIGQLETEIVTDASYKEVRLKKGKR